MDSKTFINTTILIVYFLYFIIEVYHDSILAKIRTYLRLALKSTPLMLTNEEERRLNESWHSWDWKGHALLALLVSALPFFYTNDIIWFTLPFSIACIRMLTLNIGFAIKSNIKNKLYLGDGKVDKFLYKHFKNYWPIPISIVLLTQILLMIYL